jgi:hypothetical protein
MRKLLRKGMPCNTDATSGMEKMMAKAGVKSSSSPSAPSNIRQAQEITRGINSKHKAAASNKSSNALKSDRTPSNATFLSNKNKSSNNHQYRNDLSKFTPEKKKEVSMQERTRKQATKKSFSPTATPRTVEIMDIIQERVCDPEDVLFTVVEDMNPVCSQDALGFCMKRAQRELSSKKQG